MIYIIDTNILIFQIRDEKFNSSFIREYLVKGNILAMSEVTLGEIKAFAMQHEWGIAKQQKMNEIINYYNIIDLSSEIIEMYAIIDTYSQGKLAKRPLPSGMSARNMGKNDLWIAATTAVSNATLITADNDFDHLDFEFIRIDKIQH